MRLVVALSITLACASVAHASCPERAAKTLPVARGSIAVDGKLDDETWQRACFVEDFTQKQPVFGARPAHPLRVAVALDDRMLYIAARMWSAGPHDISDALTQRDDTSQAERLIVSIDPSHTGRLAYSFAVTARGVRADWIHTDDSEFDRDLSWNPVWVAKAELLADGWVAEMAIPLSQLRLPRVPQTSWGINFNWYLPHRQEDVFWISVPPDRMAWASMFGELTDLPPIDAGLGLEVMPYTASRLVLDESPTGRGAHRWLAGFEAGLDIKLRPLAGITVAATINPDFGQVESDPAFVNLTAFEVRLPERRPFFVENAPLFANAGGDYFYSRRIGASGARILGALAVGAYAAASTQVAILGAVTDEHSIASRSRPDGEIVAPLTGWSAARIEHQIGPSVIGATATAVGRALAGTALADLMPSSAFVAGGDATLRSEDRTYELAAVGGVTSVLGSAAALERVQEAPRITSSDRASATSHSTRRRRASSAGTPVRAPASAQAHGRGRPRSAPSRRATSSTTSARSRVPTTSRRRPSSATTTRSRASVCSRGTRAAVWPRRPDLVLTLYAQPFVSIGRYDRIGELAAARRDDVRWYGVVTRDGDLRTIVDGATSFSIDEPDFRVVSLRSTAVMRWELAPGSTLFAVWQQARDGTSALHTLAIKLSYWFG